MSRLSPKVPSLPSLPKYINTANCVKDEKAPALEDAEVLDEVKENKKRHLNVVFIGHVEAGKSTFGGQIPFLSGQVDERTIQKYEKEAKDKSRESWYMAYIKDTDEEERIKKLEEHALRLKIVGLPFWMHQ
ncbi:hypothetical protein SLEP1_g47781 [Rubroshorea leprosula]|uniref:Tr-type G domain-containing protein n=1 Tax=Rubroshorea leprosula TaxID=152421 RepID=A0AAV5LRR7_9ROSI|nr:hypothetical protein SLEP1_g47781 [Rubroshorea leprosula]